MDIEDDPDVASACKRQKRNNSSNESCNDDDGEAGTSKATGTDDAAAPSTSNPPANHKFSLSFLENKKEAKKTVKSNNNNNHSGKGDEIGTDEQTSVDVATTINAADDDNLSPSSISASSITLSVPEIHLGINNTTNIDGSPSSIAVEVPEINLATMTTNYTNRSGSPNSSDHSSDHNSDANNDTNDTEVDSDGDATDEAAEAANTEGYASYSPVGPFPEDSSSDSSDGFWARNYASSNEGVDSDDDVNEIEANPPGKEQVEIAVNKIMCKSKPSYTWNCSQELMLREHNLFNRIGWRGGHTSALSFSQGYYGSRQVAERMAITNIMSWHRGCVNCLNFNRSGDLICSGSDDLSIVVWDWANGKPRHTFKSGHTLNIFQTKFIDSAGCLDIVSSSRDGHVRRTVIPPSGSSSYKPMRLYSHNDAVHKIVVVPQSRHEIMSAGEDAQVKHFDLRSNTTTTMLRGVGDKRRVRLFSIAHHPYTPEFCISGSDDKLRVYDKRKLTKSVHEMTPKDDKKLTQITCAVYNHSGSEILASCSETGIYLFDSRNYKDGEFLHFYEGHINKRTIKGVNFFGPHSEYIVSGSDCGHIFFWDKNTESVINFMKGDLSGVVNCLEPHPWMPVLATSGLEHHVKIWTPKDSGVPNTDALKKTLQRNIRRNFINDDDFDIQTVQYFIRHLIHPRVSNAGARVGIDQQDRDPYNIIDSSDSSSTTISSRYSSTSPIYTHGSSNESSSDESNADPLGCRTQ